MKQYGSHDPETRVVVDDTTIYEVDMECYYCLTDRERELYYDGIEPGAAEQLPEQIP
jgi:hypothetical protein